MNNKNVLILSAGRRVELVKAFKNAQKKLNMQNAKVIAVDISKYAPALYFADNFYLVPRVTDIKYIDTIIDIAIKENIDLIVPTIDTELYVLALNKRLIEEKTNAKVLISDKEIIEICNDKNKTIEFLQQNGFDLPNTLNEDDLKNKAYKFPLFIKPKDGSSSINTFIINDEKELQFFKEYVKEPIIQERIEGNEYTVDVCMDFEGNVISIVPRIRIATRSGEISKGKIDKNNHVIEDVKRLMQTLKPIGHITVQCFLTKDNVIKYIEINPRFGGGAPMSFYAGANSPEFLLRMLNGEELSYCEDFQDGLVFSRFDDSILIEEGRE
jgi:carbamoyl-phosphate synthase large subunit